MSIKVTSDVQKMKRCHVKIGTKQNKTLHVTLFHYPPIFFMVSTKLSNFNVFVLILFCKISTLITMKRKIKYILTSNLTFLLSPLHKYSRYQFESAYKKTHASFNFTFKWNFKDARLAYEVMHKMFQKWIFNMFGYTFWNQTFIIIELWQISVYLIRKTFSSFNSRAN